MISEMGTDIMGTRTLGNLLPVYGECARERFGMYRRRAVTKGEDLVVYNDLGA